jgi:hypothetical protein
MKTLILFVFFISIFLSGNALITDTAGRENASGNFTCDEYKYEIICDEDDVSVCWLYTYCDDRLVSVEVIDPH